MNVTRHHRNQTAGFTIVELLIVIVVIGILATIAFLAYNGVSRQATVAVLRTDLESASKQLKYDQVEASAYPATTTAANGGLGLKASKDTTYQYTVDNTVTPQTFCLTATNGSVSYYISNDGAPTEGACSGHTVGGVVPNGPWQTITGGFKSVCGKATGSLYCWGNSTGAGNASGLVAGLIDVSGALSGKTISAISTGSDHTCVIANSQAYCWGANIYGKLGNGNSTASTTAVAVNTSGVLSGKSVTAISGGLYHTCAVADGKAYCWGENGTYGKLGNNSTTNSTVPVAVDTSGVLSGKTVTAISAGMGDQSCAIADGKAYCWGSNINGRLGDGTGTNSQVPVAVNASGVLSGKTVTAISAGGYHTCAIANSQAYCWGSGSSGKLGNGSSSSQTSPVAVTTSGVLSGKTITAISTGYEHTCALASDSKLYCWGINSSGQLGNNSTSNSTVPVAVDTSGVLSGKTATEVSLGGGQYSCALASGNVYCWGYNTVGQFGNGATGTTSLVPVQATNP